MEGGGRRQEKRGYCNSEMDAAASPELPFLRTFLRAPGVARMLVLLPWLTAALTPRPVTDTVLDPSPCVTISAAAASTSWCVSNCGAGNCPPALCSCGDQAKASEDTAAMPAVPDLAVADQKAADQKAADQKAADQEAAEPPMGKRQLLILKAEAKNISLKNINKLYAEGRASNNMSKAGLLVHQHDNTEKGWGTDAMLYKPGGKPFFATTITNHHLKGLYNDECGIIVAPSASKLLCSYYADFMSWDAGCERVGLNAANGWHTAQQPSAPRGTPYPPESFKEMMEQSRELQEGKGRPPAVGERGYNAAAASLARRALGEPGNAAGFWLGGYNEVLISRAFYESGLPWSVMASFFVEGGNVDGANCALATRNSLNKWYGANASHVLVLKHTPGADPAFEVYEPPAPLAGVPGQSP